MTSSNREQKVRALVLSYSRDISSQESVAIAVVVLEGSAARAHVRQNWEAVLKYDPQADLELLKKMAQECATAPTGTLQQLLTGNNSLRLHVIRATDADDTAIREALAQLS